MFRGRAKERVKQNERTQSLLIHASATILHMNFQIDRLRRIAADGCPRGVCHVDSDAHKSAAGEFDRVLKVTRHTT